MWAHTLFFKIALCCCKVLSPDIFFVQDGIIPNSDTVSVQFVDSAILNGGNLTRFPIL